ncbi:MULTISPECIES: MFS transporter [Auritidibacter]|uniref:MFS transporter n=1 Tax=Auritidibacter ignavus TaxID=678932 RepID=A0AAJ6AIS6_9MICC|nr:MULTISPECIES: MFS transporter [Auritidibacter]PXA78867.1 MFS transporter [Auritidibacter sp. NML120779]NIH71070.1 FHS family L-fucose permease-like MFS transporter [Auritidibacter ignavus]PXA75656.1 MFS transporter [Auritidibacter sp. NML100628]PXA79231.1 MFS transporter [Auritidibacter sp. NML120636]RMX22402.1 MFS transporter [Auritidibacter ignavus]
MSAENTGRKTSAVRTAIILVTALFFIWGLTMNLVNGIRDPFATYLQLSGAESSLLQVAYFGAYFVMAIPATMVAKRHGYKGGMIVGLVFFVLGAALTIPATSTLSYWIFLIAMFVIALGAAALEANCNPYMTKIGGESTASTRMNIAQGFNGIGQVIGPLLLGLILGETVTAGDPGFQEARDTFMGQTALIYTVIGIVVLAVLLVFVFAKLPTPAGDDVGMANSARFGAVFFRPYFTFGVVALFVYVGLQTLGFSVFSTFAQQQWDGINAGVASTLLAVLTVLFALGRFATAPVFKYVESGKVLAIYFSAGFAMMFLAALGLGPISVIAFMVLYFFMSIGFPTIYALALRGIDGAAAKNGAAILTMTIGGGAVIPLLLGFVQDAFGLEASLFVSLIGFAYLVWYGISGSRIGYHQKVS